jgi:hypothetical protein
MKRMYVKEEGIVLFSIEKRVFVSVCDVLCVLIVMAIVSSEFFLLFFSQIQSALFSMCFICC